MYWLSSFPGKAKKVSVIGECSEKKSIRQRISAYLAGDRRNLQNPRWRTAGSPGSCSHSVSRSPKLPFVFL